MFIGFQDIAINSRVNEGLVNRLDVKMKDNENGGEIMSH